MASHLFSGKMSNRLHGEGRINLEYLWTCYGVVLQMHPFLILKIWQLCFQLSSLFFPTPGCQTLGSRNFYIWKCFLWGQIVVIKPVNHYILLERKPKLMSFHYPSLLFYPFVSLKWLLKNIIKIYWGLGAIIDTEKIMKANPTEHQQ